MHGDRLLRRFTELFQSVNWVLVGQAKCFTKPVEILIKDGGKIS